MEHKAFRDDQNKSMIGKRERNRVYISQAFVRHAIFVAHPKMISCLRNSTCLCIAHTRITIFPFAIQKCTRTTCSLQFLSA